MLHAACLTILCDISENIDSLPSHLSAQETLDLYNIHTTCKYASTGEQVESETPYRLVNDALIHTLLNQIPQSPRQEISLWMDQREPRINQVEFNLLWKKADQRDDSFAEYLRLD